MVDQYLIDYSINFSRDSVLVSLSGGINSMAVLCWLATLPNEFKPKELHLYYVHFREHSPQTFKFVADGVRYAREKFSNLFVVIKRVSLLKFFEDQQMIPHPIISPCSRELKFKPIEQYIEDHDIDLDLIGYIRTEKKRIKRQEQASKKVTMKIYPISHFSDQDCFELVEKEIGWYPEIYKFKDNGKQVFKHNNCLPCKNMSQKDLQAVAKYYPKYWGKAQNLANKLGAYWGRLPIFKTDQSEQQALEAEPDNYQGSCDYCLFD